MEAGFLPGKRLQESDHDYKLTKLGCTYLITCWYKRFEVGKRLAAFWLISVVLNAFAAIFAYALTLLKGTYGLNGWRCTQSFLQNPNLRNRLMCSRDLHSRGRHYGRSLCYWAAHYH